MGWAVDGKADKKLRKFVEPKFSTHRNGFKMIQYKPQEVVKKV